MARALRQAGIHVETLSGDSEPTTTGVRVSIMRRAKGMEFTRVVVAGASDTYLPFQSCWTTHRRKTTRTPSSASAYCCTWRAPGLGTGLW